VAPVGGANQSLWDQVAEGHSFFVNGAVVRPG
jgi:hypothetical protein